MSLYDTFKMGKCPTCQTIYRWDEKDGLKLADAECKDCDTPLKKTCSPKFFTGTQIADVEASWLRKGIS